MGRKIYILQQSFALAIGEFNVGKGKKRKGEKKGKEKREWKNEFFCGTHILQKAFRSNHL